MTQVPYRKSSPYSKTPQTTWYLGNLSYRNIPRDSSDKIEIIKGKYNNRPDLLSYDLYGTPDYWWIFMIVNPDAIKDPIYDLKAGMLIYVPTRDRIISFLGN